MQLQTYSSKQYIIEFKSTPYYTVVLTSIYTVFHTVCQSVCLSCCLSVLSLSLVTFLSVDLVQLELQYHAIEQLLIDSLLRQWYNLHVQYVQYLTVYKISSHFMKYSTVVFYLSCTSDNTLLLCSFNYLYQIRMQNQCQYITRMITYSKSVCTHFNCHYQ